MIKTEVTRTGSRSAEAEDEEVWETAMPGIRVLVFFCGDTVGHDRVFGAPETRQRPEHAASGEGGRSTWRSRVSGTISRACNGPSRSVRFREVGQFESLPRTSGNRYGGESGVCLALESGRYGSSGFGCTSSRLSSRCDAEVCG